MAARAGGEKEMVCIRKAEDRKVYSPCELVIVNAFSLNMLPDNAEDKATIEVEQIDVEKAKELVASYGHGLAVYSAIGHESTANLISQILGYNVPTSRVAIKAYNLVVFQLTERLPEGKVLDEEEIDEMLDEGKLKIYKVKVTPG